VISSLLIEPGISEKPAPEDAYHTEHVISGKSFDVIKRHIDQYGKNW